jgi:anti-sigma-K factor RskA
MRRQREDEAVELAALADGSLAPDRRAAVEAHVAASPDLQKLLAEQKQSIAYTHQAAADVDAPSGLRRRVEVQQRVPRSWTPGRVVLAGAAAVAVVAVAIGVVVSRSGTSSPQFHAALAATDLAPGASGNATLTKTSSGWRIELDATGLPRLDNGRFYEAWLKNSAGVLVPIGTFNEGTNVTLWAGVSPKDFTTLSVTREQADGDQTSSGEKVLVGPVDTSG